MTTTTITTTEHLCDVGFHSFTGEPVELHTGDWLRGDTVCVMVTCGDHAPQLADDHDHRWDDWPTAEPDPSTCITSS